MLTDSREMERVMTGKGVIEVFLRMRANSIFLYR